jgi:hypothetical protein
MRHPRTLLGASADPSAGPHATWRQPTLRALIVNSWGRGELRGDDPLPGRAHKALLALVIGQRGMEEIFTEAGEEQRAMPAAWYRSSDHVVGAVMCRRGCPGPVQEDRQHG